MLGPYVWMPEPNRIAARKSKGLVRAAREQWLRWKVTIVMLRQRGRRDTANNGGRNPLGRDRLGSRRQIGLR